MTKKLLFLSLFLAPFLVFAQSFKGFNDPTHYIYKPHLHDDDQKAPSNVFFADFNGDGHQDFVIDGAIYGQSSTGDYLPQASFFINKGDGTFEKELVYNKGSRHRIITDAYDYNDDKEVDFLMGDFWGNSFKMFSISKQLKFSTTRNTTTNTHGGTTRFADLDGDNDMDIVSISAGSGHPVMVWIYENQNNKFKLIKTYKFNYADAFLYNNIEIKDINGDDKLDIFISIEGGEFSVLSLIQNTNLNFTQKHQTLDKINGQFVYAKWWQLEDYNSDGFLDLILPEPNYQKVNPKNMDSSVYVWLGNSTADFDLKKAPDFELILKNAASRLYFTDLNDDGKHDIVYHEAYNINVLEYKETIVMLKKATNNYIKDQQLTHESSLLENFRLYGGLGLSDLNNDTSPDLVVIRDGFVQVFLNKEGKEIDGEEPPVDDTVKSLKIYPNPTRDILNIDSGNSENKIKQLELYNVLGQLIFSIPNSTPKQMHKIDLSSLSSGSYMLSITLEKGERLHRKVVRY